MGLLMAYWELMARYYDRAVVPGTPRQAEVSTRPRS
jgi:hypothetical protein